MNEEKTEPECTGNCNIISLVEVGICKTCGWIDEPPATGDPYNNTISNYKNNKEI